MNYNLRKRHLRIWVVVVLVVPVLIGISIYNRPTLTLSEFKSKTNDEVPYPRIVKEFERSNFKINLRGDKELVKQLEIIIKTPLKTASTTLHYLTEKGKGDYIGSLQSKGLYRFSVDNSIRGIVVYDAIKKQEIQQISF